MRLMVVSPFEGRAVGDHVTDPETVAAIIADHRSKFVVRVAEAAPEPEPPAKPEEGR